MRPCSMKPAFQPFHKQTRMASGTGFPGFPSPVKNRSHNEAIHSHTTMSLSSVAGVRGRCCEAAGTSRLADGVRWRGKNGGGQDARSTVVRPSCPEPILFSRRSEHSSRGRAPSRVGLLRASAMGLLPNLTCELPSHPFTFASAPVKNSPAPAFRSTENHHMNMRKSLLLFSIANGGVLFFQASAQSLGGASPIKEPYPPISSGSFSGPAGPRSPDPLVA